MPVTIVFDHTDRAAAAIIANSDELTRKVADTSKDWAETHVPVLTGALKRGIQIEGTGRSLAVTASSREGGAPREYARYVEYGTRYTAAQPFMLPAHVAGLLSVPRHGAVFGAAIEAAV